uniref:Uncharacterized protein n=1 Tax=Timema monikensis TaxID=170555 RepID=A0A7R9HST3_9NEOP|nr:unnamed protein product [Timema monikensis]
MVGFRDVDTHYTPITSTIEVDEFTRKLFEIYETVNSEGISQWEFSYRQGSGSQFRDQCLPLMPTITGQLGGPPPPVTSLNRNTGVEGVKLSHGAQPFNLEATGLVYTLSGLCTRILWLPSPSAPPPLIPAQK